MCAVAFGVLIALIGGGHFVAWLTGAMAELGQTFITMKTNAALCLFLAGSGDASLLHSVLLRGSTNGKEPTIEVAIPSKT